MAKPIRFKVSSTTERSDGLPSYLRETKTLELDPASLELNELPETLLEYKSLKSLNLERNKLSSVPAWLGHLKQLQELGLSHNQLSSVPESIWQLDRLQDLDLSHNQLSSVPESIWQLTWLQELNLSHNQLSPAIEPRRQVRRLVNLFGFASWLFSFVEWLARIKRLRRLNLSRNALSLLPEAIGNLTRLTKLDLSGNELISLPESIAKLTRLEVLNLGENQLSSLPESIGKLTQLERLSLKGNRLSSLPIWLLTLAQLSNLDLDENELSSLPESIGRLTGLYFLKLEGNQLSSLPKSIGQLTRLLSLHLQKNQLASLPESIGKLTELSDLYLRNNQLTSLPDRIGWLTKLRTLDLSSNQLTSLPESIGKLAELVNLNLQSNQLTSLPKSFGRLTKLERLDLRNNRLTSLPESIGKFTKLERLDLQNNQLTSLPESIGKLTELKPVDLQNNQLTSLPESIGRFTRWERLDLRNNQLTSLPESIGKLTELENLSLQNNRLTSLPESIGKLAKLKSLDLQNNQLRSLPESIGQLTELESLDFRGNQITTLPESIGKLAKLKKLVVGGNQLTSLPESIGQLVELESLSLAINQLKSLPMSIVKLRKLRFLDLGWIELRSAPEWLGQFTELETLSLEGNQLSSVPESVGQLTRLRDLHLSGNELSVVPESLHRLKRLRTLAFSHNRLSSVPKWLGQLKTLSDLRLGSNQLTWMPESLGQLTALESLDLSRNEVTSLPVSYKNLTKLKRLFLHGNDLLGIPSEVLGPGPKEVYNAGRPPADPSRILRYYFQVCAGKRPLNEVKLILMGRGGAGKTSLVNRLIRSEFDPKSSQTQGIQITPWRLMVEKDTVGLNIWDFGGQEIMHATHQFFLTERSLYLIVLSGREDAAEEDAEYWLKLVASFGAASPAIIVLNKYDEHRFDLNRRALQQKYPNIRHFVTTDCKSGLGIGELKKVLCTTLAAWEAWRVDFPAAWFEIKQWLSEMRESYISFEQFQEICRNHWETDVEAQVALAGYLHDLGIVLNYRNDPRLRDTHVLNPHWVTGGIYLIINAKILASRQGELHLADLSDILPGVKYPREMHMFIVGLMRKFELCFPFPDESGRYLVPDLLPKDQHEDADHFSPATCLGFEYQYPILPEGLLSRFIVRSHVLSEGQPRWRSGVILQFEGCRALVKADVQDKRVQVLVDGPAGNRKRLLAVIRSDFDRIHSSIRDLNPREMVPVPKYPQHLIDYQNLKIREQSGRTEFEEVIGKDVVEVSVTQLLDSVDLSRPRRDAEGRTIGIVPVRLFYSYAHKDEQLRNELDVHLKILERQGLIFPWHDRLVRPGEEWAQGIDANLEAANIVLLLLSADFITSDYCYSTEMKLALERHEAGEARVIPVILRDVDRAKGPFAKLQALPEDGRAVTRWPDRDSAWRDVREGIEQAIRLRWEARRGLL